MKALLTLLAMLLPGCRAKNRLLNALGHDIHPTAHVGPIIVVGGTRFAVGQDGRIKAGNIVKRLRGVSLDNEAAIARFNLITAHPVFQEIGPGYGELRLGYGAVITSRHYLDCSGLVELGPYSAIGGHGVNVLTHSMDFYENRQTAGRITVGDHSIALGYSLLLKGTAIPDRSMLAAGSVCTGKMGDRTDSLYAGNPAEFKKHITGAWFTREKPSSLQTRPDAGVTAAAGV